MNVDYQTDDASDVEMKDVVPTNTYKFEPEKELRKLKSRVEAWESLVEGVISKKWNSHEISTRMMFQRSPFIFSNPPITDWIENLRIYLEGTGRKNPSDLLSLRFVSLPHCTLSQFILKDVYLDRRSFFLSLFSRTHNSRVLGLSLSLFLFLSNLILIYS